MSHSTQRKPVNPALLTAIADRTAPVILIASILMLGLIAMCATVGLQRVENAYVVAARV
jgi:hypothetical protein